MKPKRKKLIWIMDIVGIIIIISLFVFFSYFTQTNQEFFKNLIISGYIGMLFYVIIEITSIVVIPVTTFPLIAIASNLWGWKIAGILSVFGWTIGSLMAFIIAKTFGVKVVKKLVSLEKINEIEEKISRRNLFLSVIFLRIIAPTDILSYALGVFTKMPVWSYLIATIIGITPYAFVVAYFGTIPFIYQLIALLIVLIVIIIWFILKNTKLHKYF